MADTSTTHAEELAAALKKAKHRIMELEAIAYEREFAEKRLLRQGAIFEGMHSIFHKSLSCSGIEALATTLISAVRRFLERIPCYIAIADTDDELAVISAEADDWGACGVPDGAQPAEVLQTSLAALNRAVFNRGTPWLFNDPRSSTHTTAPLNVSSFLGVPLLEQGRKIGLIGAFNKRGGFDSVDQEGVDTLSIAFVEARKRILMEMDNARKRDELQAMEEHIRTQIAENERRQRVIDVQHEEIMDLSTPVLEIWEDVLIASVIGSLNKERAFRLNEAVLQRITDTQSKVVIVDITGVTAMDSNTAHHLTKTVAAVRLIGARAILTGISPAVAHTVVDLELDLSMVETYATLNVGLRRALQMLGIVVEARRSTHKQAPGLNTHR